MTHTPGEHDEAATVDILTADRALLLAVKHAREGCEWAEGRKSRTNDAAPEEGRMSVYLADAAQAQAHAALAQAWAAIAAAMAA